MNRLRFTKVRQVTTPSRGNVGDAGLDFYIPEDLTFEQLAKANENSGISFFFFEQDSMTVDTRTATGTVYVQTDDGGIIKKLILGPHSRVLIPSGIRILIEPRESMLTAANKSGLAKKGIIFTSQVVDSPYTGEVHIGVANIGSSYYGISAGKKATQFIQVPIILSEPEEISNDEYDKLSANWGTRGNNGFGSTGE